MRPEEVDVMPSPMLGVGKILRELVLGVYGGPFERIEQPVLVFAEISEDFRRAVTFCCDPPPTCRSEMKEARNEREQSLKTALAEFCRVVFLP